MEYAMICVMCIFMALLLLGVGVVLGLFLHRFRPPVNQGVPKQELSDEEREAIRRDREELKASIAHFNSMMRYDVDTAYGMDDPAEQLTRG